MESAIKSPEQLLPISPILNDLLGGSANHGISTIDRSFDGTSVSSNRKEQLKKLELGIEDTQSKWASLRSSVKPTTGEWVQAKEGILESLASQNRILEIDIEPSLPSEAEPHVSEEEREILNLLSEATSYLKEELTVIKGELSNIHIYKGAIQNLGQKIGEGEGNLNILGEKLDDTAWVIGQKLDGIDSRFEIFKEELPAIHKSTNEAIVAALREFEDKCLRLGAAQLDSLSRIQGVENGSQFEELQESLIYLINGQKKILESISDVLQSLQAVSHSVGNLPATALLEQLSEKQEDQIDSIKLEIVESRIEDREEDKFLRHAVFLLGLICALTFGALVYSILI